MDAPSQELARIISPLLISEDGTTTTTSQASLFLARDLTGKEVVLKRTTARSKEQLESAQNEVSLMRKIRHPNVVAFCGVWFAPLQPFGTEVNLLMELCPGGHLLDLQRRRETAGRPLTEQELVRIFVQCCRGVECLHRFDPPVAHRDVKLENFVLGGEDGRVVKLCDFGSITTRRTLVTTKEERARLEEEVLRLTTPSYRAPELVDLYSRKLVSEQVDIWALGCVLYALAFGRHAFGDDGSALAILSGKFTLPSEPYYSQEFKLLLVWLLESDPNIRPRVGDVVDELDLLLGNRVKVNAERRGSGRGDRSSSKLPLLLEMTSKFPQPSPPLPVRRMAQQAQNGGPATPTNANQTSRGAAFLASAQSNATPSSASRNPSDGFSPSTANRGSRSAALESRRNAANNTGSRSPLIPFAVSTSSPLNQGVPAPQPSPRRQASPKGQVSQTLRTSPSPPKATLKRPSPNSQPPFMTTASTSNNPFDDMPPSYDPTFYSTPGMRSTSVAGFPDEFLPSNLGTPFDTPKAQSESAFFSFVPSASFHTLPNSGSAANNLNASASLPPSQAPVFFSDPPPQWRSTHPPH